MNHVLRCKRMISLRTALLASAATALSLAAAPGALANGLTFTNYTTTNGLGNNVVRSVYAKGGTIYAATNGGLSISTNNGTSWITRNVTNSGLGNDTVRGVYESDGTLYAATQGGGLGISTNNGTSWTNFTTTKGLGSNNVLSVIESGGIVYAASGGVSIGQITSLTASPASLTDFSATPGEASPAQSLTVNGTLIGSNITVTAPANFEISTNNSSFSQNLTLAQTGGNVTAAIVYVRLAATAPGGLVSGNLTLAATNATTRLVPLSGRVYTGTITTNPASLGGLFTANGTASTSQSFTVDASGLNEPVIVTAPAGFQVSTDNSTFSKSITIFPTDGSLAAVTVYTRIAAGAPAGLVSGNIAITSGSSYLTRTTADGLGSNLVQAAFASGSTVYVATKPGINGGLGISTDGGATFINRNTANSNLPNNYVNDVYAVGGTIFVATNGGLCISTDGGTSFTTRTTADGLGSNFVSGVFAAGNSVYAATNAGLSISNDNGVTFINRNTTSGLSSPVVDDVYAVGNTVHVAMNSFSPPGGVAISTNGGVSFTSRTTSNGLGSSNVWDIFVVDNTIYAATGGGLSISTDGGTNFTTRTTAHGLGHNNVNGVYVVGSTVYAATSGGLSISYDGGATFTNRTTADGLASNGLLSVFVNENTIYLATSVGLTIIAPGGPSGITRTVAVSGQVQEILPLAGVKGNNTLEADYAMTDGYSIDLKLNADYLIVAGGGGGAGSGTDTGAWGGGGGGGGGLLQGSTLPLSAGEHPVVVGIGGTGGPRTSPTSAQQGGNGGNSTFGNFTAIGGGGGGAWKFVGNSGGSGGGGGGRGTGNNLRTAGGSGTSGQGFAGGASRDDDSAGRSAGGGGGGAGAIGGTGGTDVTRAGNGGAGLASAITGGEITYAGGGGGGAMDNNSGAPETAGLGGAGGGGNGSTVGNATAGTNGLGGGGGGVGHQGAGGDGGSGVVIVRYKGDPVATGGIISTGTGNAEGFTLHTFSTPGNTSLNLTPEALTSLQATLTGSITGTGGLSFNGPGTLVLAGTNTFSGPTIISSGTLQLGNGGTTGTVPGPIVNNSVLAINRSDDLTLSNGISGPGTLVKLGNNTLTLASTVQGPVSVDSGTLRVTGSVGVVEVKSGAVLSGNGSTGSVTLASGAAISPGDGGPGTLSTGGVSLAGGAVWNWETNSTNGIVGVDSDLIESTGALALDANAENPIAFNISALGEFSLTGVKQASWVVGRFPGGITGFSAGAFAIHTGALVVPSGGVFTMALGEDNTLVLLYQTPQILPSVASLANFTATPGNASTSQSFTVDGTLLQGTVTVTAPSGFQVSLDNSSFSSSVPVNQPAGRIESVYGGNFTTATGKIWSLGNGQEFPHATAFAAITNNGSVVTWGSAFDGGNSTSVAAQLSSNVTAVYSNQSAFAALKDDGSVVAWGSPFSGGDSTSVAEQLSSNVTTIYSTGNAFAALKTDGSVVTWGLASSGGDSTSVAGQLSSNVTAVYSNTSAFAALKSDGSVVTWGNAFQGGNSTSVAGQLSSNVIAVYSTVPAFAALKSDGSVVTWGLENAGGNSTSVADNLTSNVTSVSSTFQAFAALKSDGSVVTWGNAPSGGNSTSVASQLTSNVTKVYSSLYAFAALKSNGSLVTWGVPGYGGDSTSVASQLGSNVTEVYSNDYAFAALKSDGSVVTWGDESYGGNSTSVASQLGSNVTAVYSSSYAFAALKSDGSVVTWGDANRGGNSTSVASQLSSNVTAVYSTQGAFAALKADGSVVTWGAANFGGSGGPTNIGAAVTMPATVYTRIAPTAPSGSVSGNITLTSPGAETQAVALSGFVGAAVTPEISATPLALNGFKASRGYASVVQSFTVNGSDLTANITIDAPAGFELASTQDGEFSPGLTLVPVDGTVASTSVYARLSANAPAGAVSGNITLASTGADPQQVAVSGTVTLPYEDWVAYWNTQTGSFSGATALGNADPDGDGLDNLTEFAFNGNPLVPSASLISVGQADGNIVVTFLARTANGTVWTGGSATGNGLNYEIQGTLDLLAFDTLDVAVGLDENQTGITPADMPCQRWKFEVPITKAKEFYRVKAVPNTDN